MISRIFQVCAVIYSWLAPSLIRHIIYLLNIRMSFGRIDYCTTFYYVNHRRFLRTQTHASRSVLQSSSSILYDTLSSYRPASHRLLLLNTYFRRICLFWPVPCLVLRLDCAWTDKSDGSRWHLLLFPMELVVWRIRIYKFTMKY